ncbi:MAG: ABC transporter permease, partial [Oscillospiraceae bacterium]
IGVFVQGSGLFTIILTIGLVYWVDMARLVRGQVMTLKQQEFVLAERTLGASKSRIISKHLIPNALGPIVVSMMMSVPSAIFTESFLSFIGLGVSAPQASWGTLASDSLGVIRSFPYQLIIPSISIAVTMFALNFVGDGLRDALDPKQRN